jgi:hypothetical protein
MSALLPKADMFSIEINVCFVPITDIQAVVRTRRALCYFIGVLPGGSVSVAWVTAGPGLILMVEEALVGVPLGLLLYLQYASLALFVAGEVA